MKIMDLDPKTILFIADIISNRITDNEDEANNTLGYIDAWTDLKNEEMHEMQHLLIAMHQEIMRTRELQGV